MDNKLIEEIKFELEQISELLYQENARSAFLQLTKILPKIGMVSDNIEDEDKKQILIEKLQITLEAMESGDNTYLADTIQYELVDAINQL